MHSSMCTGNCDQWWIILKNLNDNNALNSSKQTGKCHLTLMVAGVLGIPHNDSLSQKIDFFKCLQAFHYILASQQRIKADTLFVLMKFAIQINDPNIPPFEIKGTISRWQKHISHRLTCLPSILQFPRRLDLYLQSN